MTRTPGIDVSAWQDDNSTPQQIDWRTAKAAGAQFAFIKASQGAFTDQDFAYNWRAAKAAGVLRGAYHFLDYRMSASKQAQYFIGLLAGDAGELPPAVDVETVSGWPLPPAADLIEMIRVFLTTVEAAVGIKPVFYSNPNVIANVLKPFPAWLTGYPLWIANYGVQTPLSRPWPTWTFWQWSNAGDGPGYGMESKAVDMDWYNGSLDDLRAWAGGKPPEPTLEEKVARLWAAHPELR